MKKEYFLLGILSVILLAAGVWIYQIISEYQKAEREYEQLQEYVKVEKNTRDPENTKPNVAEDDKEGEKQEETVTVDFASLQAINPDIVAWLRIPGVLEYPVVRGKDNSYYLNHTVQKTYNIAGSIFLDYRNERDFSDSKNIIYGHNMKDGSMFHVLRNYQDIDFFQEHTDMEIYLPDGRTLNYQIIACEQVPADSEVYQITKYDSEKTEKQELLLSTCSARVDRRLLLRWRVK
ncbi:MAG: class B sortase [Coprococcus phoceensis]|jgi:sortase B